MPQPHAQLAAREIHGPLVQTLVNLQGTRGRRYLSKLNELNRTSLAGPLTAADFPVWKTVLLGTHVSGGAYVKMLERSSVDFDRDDMEDVTGSSKFKPSAEVTPLDLCWVQYEDIRGAIVSYDARSVYPSGINEIAKGMGFKPCPREVIVLSRLAYLDQPPKEVVYVMTDSIDTSSASGVFCLTADQGRCKIAIDRPWRNDRLWGADGLLYVKPRR